MNNLNNIPNAGNWGDAASKLNDNFNKIKQSLTTVENTSKNNKGYFTSLSALNTAFPSPKAGQTAYVYNEASSTNYYIYNAVNGAWVISSIEAPSVGVDLAEYTKTGGSTKTTKDIDDTKANHGYPSAPKTLKEVEDNASVKMTNLLQNSSFENGVIAPVEKSDGSGSASTLSINTINPISGNYDARLEVTTPSTSNGRPILRLNGGQKEWVLNHVFYFGMSVKINSGIPILRSITDGEGTTSLNLTLKDGFNSWTVKCAGLTTGFALNYLDGTTLWDFNFDNLIAYDLTAIFGEGNEPTKEEIDLFISTLGTDYFEGEITIPAQKIWQNQLKIQGNLGKKANHGYPNTESPKSLKEVEDRIHISESDIDFHFQRGNNLVNWKTFRRGFYLGYSGSGESYGVRESNYPERGGVSGYISITPNTEYSGRCKYGGSIAYYRGDYSLIDDTYHHITSTGQSFTSPPEAEFAIVGESISTVISDEEFIDYYLIEGSLEDLENATAYIEPYLSRSDILDLMDSSNVALYKAALGKNLFDKTAIIDGFYIATTSGNLNASVRSAVSGLIPVVGGEVYHIYREGSGYSGECRFVEADGVSPLKPLNADGSERIDYSTPMIAAVKAPIDAAYFQCTIKFADIEYNYDTIQFEKGGVKTSYEPYQERLIIDYPNLPSDLENLPDDLENLSSKVANLENTSNLETLNIANSDKIGFFSTSYLSGSCMKNHHHLDNLGMFSDYIMYNFGHSGDDELEMLARIERNEKNMGAIPVQDWNIKYGVSVHQENSGALFSADVETAYYNNKNVANAIKALGGQPIFATEHDEEYQYYQNIMRLCDEENYMFIDYGRTAKKLFNSVFKPFWNNSHPSTRTAWLWSNGLLKGINTLPRPTKGIKLFRVRGDVDKSILNNLLFNDYYTRMQRFVELSVGQTSISSDMFFDRLDVGTGRTIIQDEYQTIQNKETVIFGEYALMEIITPYTRVGLKHLKASLTESGVTNVYVMKKIMLSDPLPDTRYIAFGITEGAEKFIEGSTFTVTGGTNSDSLHTTYTVSGVVNGMVATNIKSQGKITSGVDTPVITSSDFDVSGIVLEGSYDYPSFEYMDRVRQPIGEWIEVPYSEGEFDLEAYIDTSMDFDKFSVLLKGNNISLSDIQITLSGDNPKEVIRGKSLEPKNGINVIQDKLLDSGTAWIGLDDVETFDNTLIKSTVTPSHYEQLPVGINTVKVLQENEYIDQPLLSDKLTLENDDYYPIKLQIRVIARYFPKYIDSDEKYATSEITPDKLACSKLNVGLGDSSRSLKPSIIGSPIVGAYWNEYIIETVMSPSRFPTPYIRLECEDKSVQIARCEVLRLD